MRNLGQASGSIKTYPFTIIQGNPYSASAQTGNVYRYQGKLYLVTPKGPMIILYPNPVVGNKYTSGLKTGQIYRDTSGLIDKYFLATYSGPVDIIATADTGTSFSLEEEQRILQVTHPEVIQRTPSIDFWNQNKKILLIGGGILGIWIFGMVMYARSPD